jgi:AcrR family transcriptional regulator
MQVQVHLCLCKRVTGRTTNLAIITSKDAPERKPRRKADIARNNIIAAAQEIFAERGYARATTRDIAGRAQSSEVLLFRYFQSKANLFREAFVDPFDGMLKTFLEAQSGDPGPDPFSGSEDFVKNLFNVVSEHRNIFFTLISTRLYEAGAAEEQVNAGGFKEYFRVAVERIEAELHVLCVTPVVSPDISSRISFVSVIATALFHDWIFGDTNIAQDKVVVALDKFIISGMAGHHPPD